MAATTPGSQMECQEWLEWCQDDHGPGDSWAELVDDLAKDRVTGTAPTGTSEGVITLMWVEIEKAANQILPDTPTNTIQGLDFCRVDPPLKMW